MSKVKANRLPAAHVKSTPDPSPQVIQDIVSSFDSGFKYQPLGVWAVKDEYSETEMEPTTTEFDDPQKVY